MAAKDISIGSIFGRWKVVSVPVLSQDNKHWMVMCRCECGTERTTRATRLRSGTSKSCGCLRADLKTTHGMTATAVRKESREYWVWNMVVQRCTNPKVKNWMDYGGRGITVCAEWLKFEAFYADMGPRPSNKHSIERTNNELGYNKDNCAWVTRDVQAKNKRNNRMLTAFGKTQHLAAWARDIGAHHTTILARLKLGWTVESAVSTPARK